MQFRISSPAAAQFLRYGFVGLGITALGIVIYYGLAEFAGIPPLIANSAAWIIGIAVGYLVHSRFSFRGHGQRGSVVVTGSRFVIVNLIGYALNSAWVWLLVEQCQGPNWWPIVPMLLLTPPISFALHRLWVFS